MNQRHYRLNVRFSPVAMSPRRRGGRAAQPPIVARRRAEAVVPLGTAIQGLVIGLPIAILLWVPIVWGLSHLI